MSQALERAVAAELAAHTTVEEVRERVDAVLAEYAQYRTDRVIAMIAAEDIETGRYES